MDGHADAPLSGSGKKTGVDSAPSDRAEPKAGKTPVPAGQDEEKGRAASEASTGAAGAPSFILGEPLEMTTRGEWAENVHSGHVAVVSAEGGLIAAAGDPDVWTFVRSTAKPVQAFPSVAGGLMESFGLDESALAMMTASHRGEAPHMEALERMLERTGVAEEDLGFAPAMPAGARARDELLRSGGGPRKLYHVCAGKHIGMLAMCRLRGWPQSSYRHRDHPLQREVLRSVGLFAGLRPEEIGVAVDGCGLPVFAMPLWRLALIYARLAAQPAGWAAGAARAAAARIAAAMNGRPALVEGEGRLASVMLGDGNVVAKSGAQGVFVFALRKEKLAVAVKVADGGESAWPGIACAALEQLRAGGGLADRIRRHFPPAIVNDAGELAGRRVPCFRLRFH